MSDRLGLSTEVHFAGPIGWVGGITLNFFTVGATALLLPRKTVFSPNL